MANLNAQKMSLAGLTPTFTAAAAGGDTFTNDGNMYLRVKNAHTAAQTVTVKAQKTCNHGTVHDAVVSVATGGESVIGPFPIDRFNNPNGVITVTYGSVTALTVAVIQMPPTR